MKAIKILVLFGIITGLLCCERDTQEIDQPDVETYIQLIRANQYDSLQLPKFSSNDIPALMAYIDDNSAVNKFPWNPISSYAPPRQDYRLGVIVLWTIESIRLTGCNAKLILGFPSQHPFVQTKSEPILWFTNHDEAVYEIIRNAYADWWNENKNKKFSSYCNIDPLGNTNFRWH